MKNILVYGFILFLLIGAYGSIISGEFSPLMYMPGSIDFFTEAMLRDAVQAATMRAWAMAGICGLMIIIVNTINIIKNIKTIKK